MSNITDTMTVAIHNHAERAQVGIGFARDAVVQAVQQAHSAEVVDQAVQDLAKAEGRAQVWWRAQAAVENGVTATHTLAGIMTRLALQGPDDKWSGRGNDVRRSHYDAVREQVTEVLDLLNGY